MKTRYCVIAFALLVLLPLISPGNAFAQDYTWATCDIVTECAGTEVDLTYSVNIYDAIPEQWVGFVLVRWTNGICNSDVILTDVIPFPEGEQSYSLHDPLTAGLNVFYNLYAIDAEGNLADSWIPYPRRQYFTHVRCPGGHDGFGFVRLGLNGYPYVDPCPDPCWHDFAGMDAAYPEDMANYVHQYVFVYGEIISDMCGDFIRAESFLPVQMDCGFVATQTGSWGSLKKLYR